MSLKPWMIPSEGSYITNTVPKLAPSSILTAMVPSGVSLQFFQKHHQNHCPTTHKRSGNFLFRHSCQLSKRVGLTGGSIVKTEVSVRWDGCDRYYLWLCGGGGVASFSGVVSGYVGGDSDCIDNAAVTVTVSLVGMVRLSITKTMIMKWSALRQTRDYECDDLEIKSSKEK